MAAFARPFVYSTALDLVSADVFVDKLQRSLKHPIHYVDGGWQTLVDGLRRVAVAAGVRIATGAHVEAVLHQDGKVSGVRTRRGEIVNASAIILATPPREAAALVDAGAFPGLRRLVETLVPAQLACLDVALRTLPRPEHPVVMDLERPLFLTAQSRYARVAPQGAALVHTFKQLDPRRVTAAADDEAELEGLLDAVQPGWRAGLVRRYALPRIEVVGALPLARTGGMSGRPGSEVPGLARLFVAGDWVGAEGFLVDASVASARHAARLVLALEAGSSGGSTPGHSRVGQPAALARSEAPAAA
jgi:phytoene dehydrogenase-like protein